MAEQDNTLLNADNLYEEVEGEDGKTLNLEAEQRLNLVGVIQDRFKIAEDARRTDEGRWIKSYENYRGLYGKKIRFRESEKSRVFVKITKTKVLASFGQIIEVLFGAGKFPIGVEPTPIPEDAPEYAHLKPPQLQQQNGAANGELENPYGFPGDGRDLPKGATADMLMENLAQDYKKIGFDEGAAPDLKSMLSPSGSSTISSLINVATLRLDLTVHSHFLTSKTSFGNLIFMFSLILT